MAAAGETRYRSPDDMALSSDGKRLFVVCSGSDEVLAIDTATVVSLPGGYTLAKSLAESRWRPMGSAST